MVADNKYTFQIIGDDKTKAAFKSLNQSMRKSVNLAGQFGAGVAASLAVMVSRSVKAGTEMSRLARSVSVSTSTLSSWSHAAETVGIESDKMGDIFKDVSDKIGDFAVTGGGGAADMFEKLNLDIKDFINLAPDQQIIKIGEALDGVQSESEKVFFLEALAGDASRLLPLLENDAELLRELTQEAEDLGVAISDVDAVKLQAAGRSFERVQSIATGFANKMAVKVAPIIEVVSERLIGAATEGDRLGDAVETGFAVGAKAVSVFVDGVHGVKVALKGVQVIGRALNFALVGGFVKLIEVIADVGNAIVNGIAMPIRKILELAAPFSDIAKDALAGVDALVERINIQVPAGMQAFADAQAEAFDIARGELHALLMEDLPGTAIRANIERIMTEAEETARSRMAEMSRNLQQGADIGYAGLGAAEEDPSAERERERIAARLQRLEESYFTELQMLQHKHQQELELLQLALEQQELTEDEFRAKRLRADQQLEKSRTDLQKKSESARRSLLFGGINEMLGFIGSGSQKMFRVQKAAALAQAAVSLPAAVIDSFKNAGGYPWGIAPAAAMAAKGAAQIASIKSQSLGSGGSITSVGGGDGGTVDSAPALATAGLPANVGRQLDAPEKVNPEPRTVINVYGDVNGDTAETVLGRMRDLIDNKDVILFSPQSRQAQELQPA